MTKCAQEPRDRHECALSMTENKFLRSCFSYPGPPFLGMKDVSLTYGFPVIPVTPSEDPVVFVLSRPLKVRPQELLGDVNLPLQNY